MTVVLTTVAYARTRSTDKRRVRSADSSSRVRVMRTRLHVVRVYLVLLHDCETAVTLELLSMTWYLVLAVYIPRMK